MRSIGSTRPCYIQAMHGIGATELINLLCSLFDRDRGAVYQHVRSGCFNTLVDGQFRAAPRFDLDEVNDDRGVTIQDVLACAVSIARAGPDRHGIAGWDFTTLGAASLRTPPSSWHSLGERCVQCSPIHAWLTA